MKLHSWIRRAASKVTIAYDGSKLEGCFHLFEIGDHKRTSRRIVVWDRIILQFRKTINRRIGTKEVKLDLIKNGETIKYYERVTPGRL